MKAWLATIGSNMDKNETAILVAIVAFVAAIIGAIIGAVTNYIIAVRKERSEEERDRRKNKIEVKRAARLLQAEFDLNAAVMSKALKEKEWWPDFMKISFEAWEKFNETIAAEVSDEVWIEIFGARQSCSFMDTMRNKSVAEGTNFFWSDPYLVAGYTSMLDDLKRGSSALSPLAFPDSRSQKKREERVTMKTSFLDCWIASDSPSASRITMWLLRRSP
jgi:hypothetical protein